LVVANLAQNWWWFKNNQVQIGLAQNGGGQK
jgi:hypothetical protein